MEQHPTLVEGIHSLCLYDILRDEYHCHNEDAKLADLLVRMADKINVISHRPLMDSETNDFYRFRRGLALSYRKLCIFNQAEWWLLHLRPEAERLFGAVSQQVSDIVLQTVLLYLDADNWNEAEPYFRDAQRLAEVTLGPNDPVKVKIANCHITRTWVSVCWECGK